MKLKSEGDRLQKVLRSVCVQSATCDFVVWCLVAVLDKITTDSSRYEDFAGSSTGWIDHICVPSALGQHERAIKFFKNYHSVVVHPAVAASATRLVLEMLTSLARAYPGHFVPAKLRSADSTASTSTHSHPLSQFWHIVHGLSKGETQQLRSSGHRHSTSFTSVECSSAQGGVSASLASATLEESAVGLLMTYLNRPVVSSSSQLQDKLLRLVCTVCFQFLLSAWSRGVYQWAGMELFASSRKPYLWVDYKNLSSSDMYFNHLHGYWTKVYRNCLNFQTGKTTQRQIM
uniref:Uncharacterized protein n=1 Tax=Parascaris equorum TaxID=6256 RepID=A0A914R8N0_PAREQ